MKRRVSWYGSYGDFHDAEDNNRPALQGATNDEPGVAIGLNRKYLGGWVRIVGKDAAGRPYSKVVQVTDLGPSITGRVDYNARLASDLGFKPGNFPTDSHVEIHWLGHKKPSWAKDGAPSEARKVAGKLVVGKQSPLAQSSQSSLSKLMSTFDSLNQAASTLDQTSQMSPFQQTDSSQAAQASPAPEDTLKALKRKYGI